MGQLHVDVGRPFSGPRVLLEVFVYRAERIQSLQALYLDDQAARLWDGFGTLGLFFFPAECGCCFLILWAFS